MRIFITIAIAIIVTWSTNPPAKAATLELSLGTYPPTETDSISPQVNSSGLALTHDDGTNSWEFSFKHPNDYYAVLTITGSAAASNYDTFTMVFRIPFQWERESLNELGVASVRENASNEAVEALSAEANATFKTASTLQQVLLYRRARDIFLLRYSELSSASDQSFGIHSPVDRDDEIAAVVFVEKARDLMQNCFMVIDPDVQLAANWLNERAQNGTLYRKNVIRKDDLDKINDDLSSEQQYFYSQINQSIEDVLKDPSQEDLNYICPKVNTLFSFLNNLTDSQKSVYGYTNVVVAATDQAICLAKIMRSERLAHIAFTPEQLHDVKITDDAISNILRDASLKTALPTQRQSDAQARLDDLIQIASPMGN